MPKTKKKTVRLNKRNIYLQRGIKMAGPLKVTVYLRRDLGNLYGVYAESPFFEERKLAGSGELENMTETYGRILDCLKQGDYSLRIRLNLTLSFPYPH